MPNISREQAISLVKKALDKAKIEKRHEDTGPVFGLVPHQNIYWQEANNDIELVIKSLRMDGWLQTSVFLSSHAVTVASLFPSETDAVKALADSINYMKGEIVTLLPRASHELLVRCIQSVKRVSQPPDTAKLDIGLGLFNTMSQAIEKARSKNKAKLRAAAGGDRRTKAEWKNESTLIKYAQLVNKRKLLATRMKDVRNACLADESWWSELKQDSYFLLLSQNLSADIIAWAMRTVSSDDEGEEEATQSAPISDREREPEAIACGIAYRELGLPKQDSETLRAYYSKGKRLDQQSRNKQNQ